MERSRKHIVFPGFDGVAGRFDFANGAAVDGLVPAMELHAGSLPVKRCAPEDGSEFIHNVIGFLYLGILCKEQVHPLGDGRREWGPFPEPRRAASRSRRRSSIPAAVSSPKFFPTAVGVPN